MSIDFAALASRLLSQSRSLLAEWYPAGRLHGHEFKVGDVHGAEGESLSVNVDTGRWADFAANLAGGDLISLYAAREGVTQAEAARALEDRPAPAARPAAPAREAWTPILPAPDDAPKPADDFYRKSPGGEWTKLKFAARWAYTDPAGALLGYAVRFEWWDADGVLHKDIVPQVFCRSESGKQQWRWRSMREPRPLYNLKELTDRPDAAVIIVEGEKKVEALRKLAPQHVAVAWPGGCNAWRKADWRPLKGRRVLLWPDADVPGHKAAYDIGHHLLGYCPVVKLLVIEPGERPEGWDAADALAEGWTWARFVEWATPRIRLLTDAPTTTTRGTDDSATTHQGEDTTVAERTGREPADRPSQPARDDGPTASESAGVHVGDQAGSRGASAGARAASGDARSVVARDPDARSGGGVYTPLRGGAALHTQVGQWDAWGIVRSGRGQPKSNLENALRVIHMDPSSAARDVWFDEFLQQYRVRFDDGVREWSEIDDINLQAYMQGVIGIENMGLDTVRNAVKSVAFARRRNCVAEWMSSLVWDGKPRIDTFMRDVFGCADTDYSRAVAANFWIALAARTFSPGCKVDNMVVLEGAQGTFKSTALRIIGGEWFAEQHESAADAKAFAEVMQGKLLVEISEMDAFNRTEVTRVKQVISCQSDRYRQPYDVRAKDFPRRGVMVGTTNKDDWNQDETGARRFWPIACRGFAEITYLKSAREQLFAEATARFKAGEGWHAVPEREARDEQSKRYDDDPWTADIARWVEGRDWVNSNDIARGCLEIDLQKIDRQVHKRIAKVLRRLGWTSGGNKRVNGVPVKTWARQAVDSATAAARSDSSATNEAPEKIVSLQDDIPFQ